MRRRIAVFLFLTAMLWLPAVSTAPGTQAATCTSWTSTRIPPTTIRVYRTAGAHSGSVETVDFKYYVKVVLAGEWGYNWIYQSQLVGAMSVKQYAWVRILSWRGGSAGGQCYDVVDYNNDQVYWPEGKSPTSTQSAAVENSWNWVAIRNGSLADLNYWNGYYGMACAADADGTTLTQLGSNTCADNGVLVDQILMRYFPGTVIWRLPPQPAAAFGSPGTIDQLTSTGSLTAAWSEEPADGTTIDSRLVTLEEAAPINGKCMVDRWVPAMPAWSSTDVSPQTATGLRSGFCYRFVVRLTDSAAATTYTASSPVLVDPTAPIATFTNPAGGTITAVTDPTTVVTWTETPYSGRTITSRTLAIEMGAQTRAGSCAGAQWKVVGSNNSASPVSWGGQIHYYCYRWRLTLVDSTGHTGVWFSGVVVEPTP